MPSSSASPSVSATGSISSPCGSSRKSSEGSGSQHYLELRDKKIGSEPLINIRLILVSGKTKDFKFLLSESAGDISQFVFDNWPAGKKRVRLGSAGSCGSSFPHLDIRIPQLNCSPPKTLNLPPRTFPIKGQFSS